MTNPRPSSFLFGIIACGKIHFTPRRLSSLRGACSVRDVRRLYIFSFSFRIDDNIEKKKENRFSGIRRAPEREALNRPRRRRVYNNKQRRRVYMFFSVFLSLIPPPDNTCRYHFLITDSTVVESKFFYFYYYYYTTRHRLLCKSFL